MIPLLTAQQMRELDRIAIEEIGIASAVLMETAGKAVADAIDDAELDGPILLLAGLGNNGGDAVVAARHLANLGLEVTIAFIGDPSEGSDDLKQQVAIAERLDLEMVTLIEDDPTPTLGPLLDAHSVVVDGLFGTGLSREITGAFAKVIDAVNDATHPVISIDIPSGVDADTGQILGRAIEADVTIALAVPKLGHALYPGRAYAGDVHVADIGIPYALLERIEPHCSLVADGILDEALPMRDSNSHKGTYGHLLVVAGVPDCPGAALLTARAALRAGAGLVTLGSDDTTIGRIAGVLDVLMGRSLGPALTASAILAALEGKTAFAIGPSLEPTPAFALVLRDVLRASRVPAVVDAGALAALGSDPAWLARRSAPTVLTPHPGEMGRLVGLDAAAVQADRLRVAIDLAAQTKAHVVLKGASTVVADPDGTTWVITRGNAGMATAGMGDVLTGVIGGLLAQGVEAGLAARAGAYLHAIAGDAAAEAGGETRLIASDVLDYIARAIDDDED